MAQVWGGLIVGLFLISFALRVTALERIPPGLTHDEAGNGHDSAAILKGVFRLYFPIGYGREPLYQYSVALMTLFLGSSIFTLRITTVLWSLMTWTFTVALARRWWGNKVALFTAVGLTSTFWPLMVARVGLRAPTLPPLFTASVLAYTHALQADSQKTNWRAYVLSGLFMGLGFYTYMASRGLPAIYLTFLVLNSVLNRKLFQKTWQGTLVLIMVALIVSTPLFLHLHNHPELEYRLTQLGGPLEALKAGDWRPLWHNVTASLPMLGWRGDPIWLYNIRGRPALEPLPALLFWVGGLFAVLRLRDYRNLFILLWLGAGLAPAFITGPDATALRAIAALPAMYILIGQGVNYIQSHVNRNALKLGLTALLSLGFLATGVEATHAYFKLWGENRDVRVLYLHHVVELGRWLNTQTTLAPTVITSIYPGEFHDPYTMEITLDHKAKETLNLHWVNGQGALVFPNSDSASVYTETLSAPHPQIQPWLRPYATPKATLTFRPDDLPPAIYAYQWDANAAWHTLTVSLTHVAYVAPGDPPPGTPHTHLDTPIPYGDVITLLGQQSLPAAGHAGATLTVLTAWEILAPPAQELVLFTHLSDVNGNVIRQADHLDVPSWQWQTGDRFVQVHDLPVPPETQAGTYWLVVGFYDRHTVQRLEVTHTHSPPTPAITRVLFPLEITTE